MEKTVNIRAFKIGDYRFELATNPAGKPVARMQRIKKSGPGKGQFAHVEGYYFHTEERRVEWVKEKIESIKKRSAEAAAGKKAKAEARANMVNPYKVGDILYDSWGYDQTNIDFFQVIEVKAKSVVIQEISGQPVEGRESCSWDSSYTKPAKDSFTGKPVTKILQVGGGHHGHPAYYYIHSKFGGSLSPYDAGEKGLYYSWGH